MNEVFKKHIDELHSKFEALVQMKPVYLGEFPISMPSAGVYLFSEGLSYLYVGRSKRLKDRLRYHCSLSAEDAPFAFKLAREKTGNTIATYVHAGSRKQLLSDPAFRTAFQSAKERIRKMEIRFVEESDSTTQALLEIYVSIVLGTRYNDFDTH